jgi:hypothetical protein
MTFPVRAALIQEVDDKTIKKRKQIPKENGKAIVPPFLGIE